MDIIKAHTGTARQWVIVVSEKLHLFLKDDGVLTRLNLLSPCCYAYVTWDSVLEPDKERYSAIFCGKCGDRVWARLDTSDPAYSHYAPIDSPLLQDWCELGLDPFTAVLAADELKEIARDLLGLTV